VDASETAVYQYLTSQGFASVIYEPDGNVPPDFLVDGRIAVEVRRLNQHEDTGNGPRGLEHVQARVVAVLRGVCASIGPAASGVTWFLICQFRRPLPRWRELRRALQSKLGSFVDTQETNSAWIEIVPRFRIQLWRSPEKQPNRFVVGALSDHDWGGFVLSEMRRNLLIVMDEKRRKVARVRSKYDVWWLVLANHIDCSLSARERQELRAMVSVDDPWERVVLVDPAHPERAFDL